MPDNSAQSIRPLYRLCAIATVVFVAYAVLLSICSVAGFPMTQETHSFWPWLGSKPVGEDGFYMLTVADNIATTHHITYNYGKAATGIQPLSTFVFAGIAWVVHLFHGGTWALIRAMILEGSLLFACFSWMMGFLAAAVGPRKRSGLVFTVAFFVTLCDYDLFRLFTYGLETGIYLCLIAGCFWLSIQMTRSGKASWKNVFLLGTLGGFAGLARIDFGVLFALVLVFLLLKRITDIAQTVASGLIALAITSPWFFFVHSVSGSWLPSSGHAESRLFTSHDAPRLFAMAKALFVHTFPWIYSNLPTAGIAFLGVITVLLMSSVLYRAKDARAWLMGRDGYIASILPWIVGIACFAAIYAALFANPTFYVRYTSLLVIFAVPVIAVVLAEQSQIASKPALLITPLAVLFVFYCFTTLHRGVLGTNFLVNAGYIQEYYPTEHVASFQSGTIGYFDRNVENLDGKLNSGAVKAISEHRMDSFIDEEGINVILDWPTYIADMFPANYIEQKWVPCPHPMTVPASICLLRRSKSQSAGTIPSSAK